MNYLLEGERTLFFIDENGAVKNQKLLEFHPACLTTYPIEESKEPTAYNLVIGTFNNSIKIYKENQLIWAAGLNADPVLLKVSKFGYPFFPLNDARDTPGLIVCLDELGFLSVNYLGTEPSATVVGVQPESKEFNYEDMDEELRILQAIIKEATSNSKPEPPDRITLKVQDGYENVRLV